MKPKPSAVKKGFAERIAVVDEWDVLQDVSRWVDGVGVRRFSDLEARTLQNDGTGPATVAYRAGGSTRLVVKLFADDSGSHSYQMLKSLWDHGFDRSGRYRVAEPVAFSEKRNLFLMRGAPGECLADYLTSDFERARQGVRDAARWLLHLHSTPLRRGRVDRPWYMFLKMSDRLSKAAAAHPDMMKELTGMVDVLSELADKREPVEPVQTHGQYRPIHVFIDRDAVTVIDLDRSVPAEPARDVAEFLHRMRSTFHREAGDEAQADQLTSDFIQEYAAENPVGLRNLPFYSCFHVLVSMCRHLKNLRVDDPNWKPTFNYYSKELEYARRGPSAECT